LSHISNAIAELERQKEVIDRALSALRGLGDPNHRKHATNSSGPVDRGKPRLSPEGRARIAAAAKKRWAQQRVAQNGASAKNSDPLKKAVPTKKTKKRVLSAEARKKMSLAAKRRWATRKKAA
jgi:hypothetical protein